jgi:hypothetical protein
MNEEKDGGKLTALDLVPSLKTVPTGPLVRNSRWDDRRERGPDYSPRSRRKKNETTYMGFVRSHINSFSPSRNATHRARTNSASLNRLR